LRGKETVSFRPEVDSSARASVYTLLLHWFLQPKLHPSLQSRTYR
jgi:hypothetical protein